MESLYPELNLCGITKECARTDTVFFPIAEVSEGTVSLAMQRGEMQCSAVQNSVVY